MVKAGSFSSFTGGSTTNGRAEAAVVANGKLVAKGDKTTGGVASSSGSFSSKRLGCKVTFCGLRSLLTGLSRTGNSIGSEGSS
ncbi:hypothetical protein D3C87_862140 [compost metagenome]